MKMRTVSAAFVMAAMLMGVPASAASAQIVFVVRHAERVPAPAGQPAAPAHGMLGEDPPLSAAGEQRAARLATMLASAGIRHVFTSEYKRTRQTAAPLAEKLKLTPVMAAAKDPDPLIAEVRRAQGNVLIVGHSNTVPELLKKLGVAEPIAIGDNDYDDLFIVIRSGSGEVSLVKLKY
jgi:broad specificity phosphatase PhoE